MNKMLSMIIDRVVFEAVEGGMDAVEQFKADLAEMIFNSMFGSPLSSLAQVGKTETMKRAKFCGEMAMEMLEVAMEKISGMSGKDLTTAAIRVVEMG